MRANDSQVAGGHYLRKSIQPWDVVAAWDLGFFDGNALKYIARWREKGGTTDLHKAIHYLQKLIEVEEGAKQPEAPDVVHAGQIGADTRGNMDGESVHAWPGMGQMREREE